ncbi:MAG: hypothetical protein J5J00_06730 [Deltaproteobacteria bacterium]|nr:hypothetical protein [Deltaproteobacteria bacterium]
MISIRQNIIEGVSWSGAFFGLFLGLLTYLFLTMLGVAIAGGFFGFNVAEELGWMALIWIAITFAVCGFVAGFSGARAAPGLTTRSGGAYIGTLAGTLLLMIFTFFTINSLVSIGRGAFGAAEGVVSGVSNANLPNLQALGIQTDLQRILSGIDRAELEEMIARNAPDLNQQQVSAATEVAITTIRNSFARISGSLANVGQLGDVISREADTVYNQLTGDQFVQRLQQQGLAAPQAREVAGVLEQRINELRNQLRTAVSNLTSQLEDITQQAAEVISQGAWMWLLAALIIVGFSWLGGVQGSDAERVEDIEEMQERERIEGEMPMHH